jgi:hypothetical protein
MTDATADAADGEEKLEWDERWEELFGRLDRHAAFELSVVAGLGLLATLGVTGTQVHDWLHRDQGLRGAAVPITLLLLGGVVAWSLFLPCRTDRHLVDVPALTAAGVVCYGVHWGMIPVVHPQTAAWWIWHTVLVTLLCLFLLALPAALAALFNRGADIEFETAGGVGLRRSGGEVPRTQPRSA